MPGDDNADWNPSNMCYLRRLVFILSFKSYQDLHTAIPSKSHVYITKASGINKTLFCWFTEEITIQNSEVPAWFLPRR